MTEEIPEAVRARAEEFVRRVLEIAPDLSEEQLENIRRASAGEPPIRWWAQSHSFGTET